MRESYENVLNSNLSKMFNTNRDYINQEINRLASPDQRSVEFRRNGTGDFGARQMVNYFGDSNYATIGTSMSSTTVS
jgi:hypothetical protein